MRSLISCHLLYSLVCSQIHVCFTTANDSIFLSRRKLASFHIQQIRNLIYLQTHTVHTHAHRDHLWWIGSRPPNENNTPQIDRTKHETIAMSAGAVGSSLSLLCHGSPLSIYLHFQHSALATSTSRIQRINENHRCSPPRRCCVNKYISVISKWSRANTEKKNRSLRLPKMLLGTLEPYL